MPLRAAGRDTRSAISRLDLISCRNLLIYLDGVAQQRVLRTFHYALRPEGMLIFGPAESIGPSSDLFEQVDKRLGVPPIARPSWRFRHAVPPCLGFFYTRIREEGHRVDVDAESLLREADRLLLARFAPASLVINQALTILQFRSHRPVSRARRRRPQLRSAARRPSGTARQDHPAIQEASRTGAPSHHEVRMEDGRAVSLEIIPPKGHRTRGSS